jgi:hypothetical protein
VVIHFTAASFLCFCLSLFWPGHPHFPEFTRSPNDHRARFSHSQALPKSWWLVRRKALAWQCTSSRSMESSAQVRTGESNCVEALSPACRGLPSSTPLSGARTNRFSRYRTLPQVALTPATLGQGLPPLEPSRVTHSLRRATMGSIAEARRAGR